MTGDEKKVSFGYESVSENEKTRRVGDVFDSVSEQYDLMNDLMSFGVHRFWKRFAMMHTGLEEGMKALDVASGTGDLGVLLADQVGKSGTVVLTDINASMLNQGRSKLLDQGKLKNINLLQANAENLPFEDHVFDCVTIAFGLRNITHKNTALSSMYRVIKPGGRLLNQMLDEFPNISFKKLADYIIDFSQKSMEEKIKHLPIGVYRNSMKVDGYDKEVVLKARLEVKSTSSKKQMRH